MYTQLKRISFNCQLRFDGERIVIEKWDRMAYSAANCSLKRTLDIIGDKWAIPILREAFFGITRFSDFERTLGCARNLLSERLSTLVEADLLARVDYQEPRQRKRSDYRLTDKGRELLPVLIALLQWGDRWTAGPKGAPLRLKHHGCGGKILVDVVCDKGHSGLHARAIEITAGPGALLAES